MIVAATEDLLGVLKYGLLALLYLFFARVLWAVWSEVRTHRPPSNPKRAVVPPVQTSPAAPLGTHQPLPGPTDNTANGGIRATTKPMRRKTPGGTPTRLTIREPKARRGESFLVTTELTIGRNDTCSITLADDTYASGLHARVFHRDGAVYFEDMGSTNGSRVNGDRALSTIQLHIGDEIQIGNTLIEATG